MSVLKHEGKTRWVHRARFVMSQPERVLENAAVCVGADGRILRVRQIGQAGVYGGLRATATTEAEAGETETIDWGDAVLLPGLVNAHAHLELTALGGRLTRFDSFTDWALRLIRDRREWSPEEYRASTREGAHLALASGTTLVGDISSSGFGWGAVSGASVRSPRRVVFEETLGLTPELADAAIGKVRELFHQADQADRRESQPLQIHAVSPHAPYSTSGELYRKAAEFVRSRNAVSGGFCRCPWTTHVAETLGELRFFETGEGEFREFLQRLGALPDNWVPPKTHPVVWLDGMNLLGSSCLLAHCNYLDDGAIGRIARSRARVVYCPRSHAFFGHENQHPIRRLLDAGVPVALGTDSLASNDSLGMLDEMRFLRTRRKDLAPEEIFRAATSDGAAALGFAGNLGCLEPGYFADMAVLQLPPNVKSEHLPAQILEGAGQVCGAIINGAAV
ncbi:MAG: amidohydrolase family protein [Acidobacteriota bacterium]|jgi:cytosine/adenosine deaminase-related metal-dependent hydrolase|nr:amidohydrolase family protein [Acidobacteriota bacterium]